MNTRLDIAMRADVLKRSTRVALLVGIILIVINYFDRILVGNLHTLDYVKMAMTFCVPFCVSTHASVSAIMEQQRAEKDE